MFVKAVLTTDFICKCCPAYNFARTNMSEYLNGLLIFLAVLHTLHYSSLRFPHIITWRVSAHPNILVYITAIPRGKRTMKMER
jgi:hypothetical protein